MTTQYLQQAEFGRRWGVESFFSALKRTMGSALSARRPDQMLTEAALKVLAYTLRRWPQTITHETFSTKHVQCSLLGSIEH
jgi:hypothetical protein